MPYAPRTGSRAKADDPATWARRREAEDWARRHVNGAGGGVGIELGASDQHEGLAFGGVDLDTCRDPATGQIEPWALEVMERFASYTEVSPSGTGVKVFFTYAAADLPALRAVMGTDHGKQFKKGKGDHPPAIELHLGNRYFAVTDQHFESAPRDMRPVDLRTLLWAIKEAGPALVRSGRGEEAQAEFTEPPPAREERYRNSDGAPPQGETEGADPDHAALLARLNGMFAKRRKVARRWEGSTEGLNDSSRSGMDMSMMALLRRCGFSFPECKVLLRRWPHGKGEEASADERYWQRLWDRGARPEDTKPDPNRGNRPLIRLLKGNIAAIVDAAEGALIAADLGIYQRGPYLVRPGLTEFRISGNRTTTGLRLLEMGDHALREALDTAAAWEKWDARSDSWVVADAPMDITKTYQQRAGLWRLPNIAGVTNGPTLRPDGSILQVPGYDEATGLLYDPQGEDYPEIPVHPTRRQAEDALQLLRDLIQHFNFCSDTDRAVALAGILTACIRRSLRTAPAFGFTAPTPGSGKSKLVDIAGVVATGREVGVVTQGRNDEETEKRLGALLLAGAAVVSIDNATAPVGGDMLCQMMTQPVVRTRILGKSEMPEMPSDALVMATGNNLAFLGDMTRRALLCQLDPGVERPELRVFDFEPVARAKARRGSYLAAALTILRAFHVAGRPAQKGVQPLGSFEEWSGWVRNALIWLDCADPVASQEAMRKLDPEMERNAEVMAWWWTTFGDREVRARDVLATATEFHYGTTSDGAGMEGAKLLRHAEFRDALLAVAGKNGVIDRDKLGKWLRDVQKRVIRGFRLGASEKKRDNATLWRLVKV
ncbi:hypothetical protein M0638_12615 [Roseomonas sp. NAR14]|uniref:DNA primase/polymerase bifunctional N-terminal domain-containing protein n=1 Tax=Roseomonas acroporae TaxID=2937791 RepID=A0A9X1Y8T2_9PROT|nr:hypothetical protein [Roseomonas acroporae]MCK8785228.1 hypothetical protein [Roseomonas acroporae]